MLTWEVGIYPIFEINENGREFVNKGMFAGELRCRQLNKKKEMQEKIKTDMEIKILGIKYVWYIIAIISSVIGIIIGAIELSKIK